MSVVGATLRGLRQAAAEPQLVVLLWLVNLLLALLAALPLATRFFAVLPVAPDGDRGLAGISFGLLHDLLAEQGALGIAWAAGLGAVGVLALALNALLAGGVLECLGSTPGRFFERFARGAGRTFGRFLRLGLVAGPLAVALGVTVAVAVGALGGTLEAAAWEPAELVARAAGALLGGLVLILGLVALDLTRIEVARADPPRVVRLFFRRLGAVLRRPGRPLGLWLCNAALLAPVLGLYLLIRGWLPGRSILGLAVLLVMQQAVIAARVLLRVSLWVAERELAERRWPLVPLVLPVTATRRAHEAVAAGPSSPVPAVAGPGEESR